MSAEWREKLSQAKLGKPNLAARGLKRTEETKQRMRKPRSYKWALSAETKARMSVTAVQREADKKVRGVHCGQSFGYQHTEDAKIKMSLAAYAREARKRETNGVR